MYLGEDRTMDGTFYVSNILSLGVISMTQNLCWLLEKWLALQSRPVFRDGFL